MQSLDLKEGSILFQLRIGLDKASYLIKQICGGEISKIDIQKVFNKKEKNIKFLK